MSRQHLRQYSGGTVAVLISCLLPHAGFAEKDPYSIISEKNLFRPDRSEWVIEKTDSNLPQKAVDPDTLELFGTIIVGDKKSALIYHEKPREKARDTRKGRIIRKRQRKKAELYSPGDYIGGYTVSKIEEKKVVLDYRGETLTLNLQDGKEPTQGVVTPLAVEKPQPKRTPKSTSKSRLQKKTAGTQRMVREMEKKIASGKIPQELKPFMSQENMEKLQAFNKEILEELKESGGSLDPATIKEKVKAFRENFIQQM